MPSRILILRGGALGDFMLTLPAIAALRRCWPSANLELVGHQKSACLALASGLIDRCQELDSARLALYFQKECPLPRDEKEYIRSFDLIVSYLHDPEGILLKHLKEAGPKNIIAASPLVRKCRAADHFYKTIKDVVGEKKAQTVAANQKSHFIKCDYGFAPPGEQFLLKWPQCLKEKARLRLFEYLGGKEVIIIHPGSGSPTKNWPAEKFALLATKIRNETLLEPLIIGGEADTRAIAVMRSMLPGFHTLTNMPLLDLASILSVASAFVGNDSGITHVAASLGIPTVALFGPTDPAVWGPRGENVSVIKSRRPSSESLAEIGIEDVFSALKKIMHF